MKRLTSLLVALTILGMPLLVLSEALAASASLSLTSPKSAGKGSTVTVSLYVNSDVAVNSVEANLSYPANLVDFVSIGGSSKFSIEAPSGGGGGNVTINRATSATNTSVGRQLVATIRFRAKVDSGNATINITGGNVYDAQAANNVLGGKSGTTFALTPPAAAPPAPVKDTTPPTISEVAVTDVSINGAAITWKTSEPANSIVQYGFNNQYGIVAQDNNMVTDHKVTLNPAVLGPVTTVHFLVKSADGAGNTAEGKDQTFTTKGLTLVVKVTDKKSKKPVSGAVVKLENSKAATTNDKGEATVVDLPSGNVLGVVKYKDKETFVSLTLQPFTDAKLASQNAAVAIDAPGQNILVLIVLIAIFLLLLGLAWLIATGRLNGTGGGLGGGLSAIVGKLKGLVPKRGKPSSSEASAPTANTEATEGASSATTDTNGSSPSSSQSAPTTSGADDTTIIRPTQNNPQ